MPIQKKYVAISVIAGIAILGVVGTLAWRNYQGTKFRYTGTLEADESDLSPGVSSQIEEVTVSEGDLVAAGQVLMKLDCRQVRIDAANVQNDFERTSRLYTAGSASKANYDKLNYEAQDAALQVSFCEISSPIDAVVSSIYHRKGEWIRPGMNVITIQDIKHPYAYIYVPYSVRSKLNLGAQVAGILAGDERYPFTGKVTYLRPNAEYTPKNVQTEAERERLVFGIKIAFENPDLRLTPGMPIDVDLSGTP
jgi:HlyD family secretion protein